MSTPSTATAGQEHSLAVEIHARKDVRAVKFTANGEYLLSGGLDQNVRVWKVQGSQQVAATEAMQVLCLAVSKDGKWIAAGSSGGGVFLLDAKTYESVWVQYLDCHDIHGVDFSPDSTRLVVASFNCSATVWDLDTRKQVQMLQHQSMVIAAKFSPQGNRIATATLDSVRIWEEDTAHSLADIPVTVTPYLNNGLLWLNDHLFVVSRSAIKQLDTSTGSIVSQWLVPDSDNYCSCIAIPDGGEFIAYSASRVVTFWDVSTHTQLSLIRHHENIRSIAFSPCDRIIVIGGRDGKVIMKSLPHITVSTASVLLDHSVPKYFSCFVHLSEWVQLSVFHRQEPVIQIDQPALDLWKHDQLEDAEASLTAAIEGSKHPNHQLLAARALLRTRLRQWDIALVDAEMALNIEPSVITYIAKSVAYVGKGARQNAYWTCNIASERFHSSHASFLLLIKAIILFMAGEHSEAISRMDGLITSFPFSSICYTVQSYMYLILGNTQMDHGNHKDAIQSFNRAQAHVRSHGNQQLLVVSLMSGWDFDGLGIRIGQQLCEALCGAGHETTAWESLLELVGTFGEGVRPSVSVSKWMSDFVQRCCLQRNDVAVSLISGDSRVLMIMRIWAEVQLADKAWKDVLLSIGNKSDALKSIVYQVICEYLEAMDRTKDAIECFHQMMNETEPLSRHDEEVEWIPKLRARGMERLETLGDDAMVAIQYDDAISLYSVALSLYRGAPQDLLVKRSKAYAAKGLWTEALSDADQAIVQDPSSPQGYERKYSALHQAGKYQEATRAFEEMQARMSRPVDPADARAVIRSIIQDSIRDSPRVLINTLTGRLCDKSEQAASFESLPVFSELLSSMVDPVHIKDLVSEHYRYGMLSHKWEANEPLFEEVAHTVVYDLEKSPTHQKLQMFCKIARDAGLHWAWSDSCCVNKADSVVLQESLVAMYKWYLGSTLTIVYLYDVPSPSRRGDITGSFWHTRAWTLQEYLASKAVRFYTKDWKPYLDLDVHNHKEAPEIISEMEEVTGVSARALVSLRPGLENIREKLRLFSRRETTYVEDEAYSLFGMFSTSLPVVYGEENQALGRLLAQLLTNSADTSILAWTGRSGSFNSCLPASITVFQPMPPPHIPLSITNVKMEPEEIIASLHTSASNPAVVQQLYDRIYRLPVASFSGRRMKLPCLTFNVKLFAVTKITLGYKLQAETDSFGVVEITTREDLRQLDSLILVHPWIDFLLDRRPIDCKDDSSMGEPHLLQHHDGPSKTTSADSKTQTGFKFIPGIKAFLQRLSSKPQTDNQTQALRFLVRLRQPFGALLLTPTRSNVAEYRRVAADSMIMVQVQKDTPLSTLLDSAQILDVL